MADISKIKLNDTVYDVKDSELRCMLDILLGKTSKDSKDEDSQNSKK